MLGSTNISTPQIDRRQKAYKRILIIFRLQIWIKLLEGGVLLAETFRIIHLTEQRRRHVTHSVKFDRILGGGYVHLSPDTRRPPYHNCIYLRT